MGKLEKILVISILCFFLSLLGIVLIVIGLIGKCLLAYFNLV